MGSSGRELAVITGPTASGKSAASVEFAKLNNGEVISADSMQVYKYMDIGSAKITADEMQKVPHHLIDIMEPSEDFNVSVFRKLAAEAVDDIKSRGRFPIVCGGTGFYIQALIHGIDFGDNEVDLNVRQKYYDMFDEYGMTSMEKLLYSVDPPSFRAYKGNKKRIVRALEYHELTGERLSDKNERERNRESVYDAAIFVLTMDRDTLYKRIDDRVDMMMDGGLVDEVRRLIDMGVTRQMTSMQAIGYRQIYDHLMGECTLEDAVYEIKLLSRHYAKRQITWFKREKNAVWIDVTSFEKPADIAEYITEYING